MIQALFYKEWIKTRRIILLLFVLFAGFVAYTFIDLAQMFRVNPPEVIWDNIILKDFLLIPNIKWLPLLAGILLAITQYVPEMVNKRFKLTLHLPLSENKIVIGMLSYGILVLSFLFAITYIVLLSGLSSYFPREFILSSFYVSCPWFLGGFAGYMLTTWIIYEPVWKYRIANAMVSICTLMLFFFDQKSGAYLPFIPYLLIIIIMSISFPFYAVIRFKEGAQ
ncbi:MAG: hypothetical protein LBN74_01230 [Prevotella sp.]|jgi:hypothetical protein|nr:hypothetical protein [Prevotella sp.]